jgi:hypothetical protein
LAAAEPIDYIRNLTNSKNIQPIKSLECKSLPIGDEKAQVVRAIGTEAQNNISLRVS